MPALNNFCVVASLAVIYNFILFATVLVPLVNLDNHRIARGKADLVCCFKKQTINLGPRKEILRPWLQK